MPSSLSNLRALCAAIALLLVFAHPAAAQLSFKPTAEAVQEDKLLNALKEGDKITGRISIPDVMASSLIQPAGRDWRDFHRSTLPIVGGLAILGMLALLAIFLMVRGRIRLDHGFSGTRILRFASFERFTHWLTASCFVVLALSGLNISFGRILILPLFGANAFATMSGYAKIAHDYLAFPFMLGLAIMFLIWIKDNIPGAIDLAGAHRVKRAFHADRADIDMRQHGGDEEHRDHGMDHRPELQRRHVGRKVREQQEPARQRHQRPADDHDPENALLPGIEALGRWMPAVPQDAAALLDPYRIEPAGNVILDPDQEHDHEAEHERERQIVVGVFRVSRHGREGFRTKQRQNENAAEADIEA